MKKIIFALALCLSCFISLEAQKIVYQSSYEKAKLLAQKQQKPLAVLITIQPRVLAPGYMNGLKDKAVIDKFNGNFINYKVDKEDTSVSHKIIREFKVYRFPSIIFLDPKGGLMFTDIAFLSRPESLLNQADKAIAASKENSLVDLDSAYNAGNKSTAFLKDYILRRRKAGINDNADLIETYVNGLAISDLNNYNEVLFILKAGPVLDGNAYKLARTNKYIIDSIYKTEPSADRSAINNAIIENTHRRAIAGKNHARAVLVADFVRSSWRSIPSEGQKRWHLKMLQYYKGVKDTVNYLQKAAYYYDRYYMNISIDSVKRRDSLNYEVAKAKAKENAVITSVNGQVIKRSFSFSYSKDRYATELNNAAWDFYNFAGNNNDYLFKAMLWSRRSVEFTPRPAFYDTYAHLLYRLKFYDEAEKIQKTAIELSKTEKADTKALVEELDKMKSRTL